MAYAKRPNDELAKKIIEAIVVDFAAKNGANTMAFEHLGKMKKARSRKKQKPALWRENGIQDYAAHKSRLKAKVPSAARRTEYTLSTLLAVYQELRVKAGCNMCISAPLWCNREGILAMDKRKPHG